MSDRELLEFAAKAAGIDVGFVGPQGVYARHTRKPQAKPWNPLTDDGDALRLAVKLKFDVLQSNKMLQVYPRLPKCIVIHQEVGDDPYAATRLAIVRAAAEIGKSMP